MTHPIPDRAHLLTIDEACSALNIGRTKTYELVMSGRLESIKIGSRRLIAVASIARYIRDQLHVDADARHLTRDVIEDMIEAGELQSITLGNYRFVSVDSLDAHANSGAEVAS